MTIRCHSRDRSSSISGSSLQTVLSLAVLQTLRTVTILSMIQAMLCSTTWYTLSTLYTQIPVPTTGSVTRYGLHSVLLSSTTMYAGTAMLLVARHSAVSHLRKLSRLSLTDGLSGSLRILSSITQTTRATQLSMLFLQTSTGAVSLLTGTVHMIQMQTADLHVRSLVTARATSVVYLHSVIHLFTMLRLRMFLHQQL